MVQNNITVFLFFLQFLLSHLRIVVNFLDSAFNIFCFVIYLFIYYENRTQSTEGVVDIPVAYTCCFASYMGSHNFKIGHVTLDTPS